MIKKEIYPKTKRVSCTGEYVEVTEKLDGSNLCIFKKDDVLYIAQRRTILSLDEIEENKDVLKGVLYKGLYQWLIDNRLELNKIRNGSVVCGEWLGMGVLKYPQDEFNKRFYMFGKANINDDFQLYNIYYHHELFIYPFEDLEIPECIGVVPVVKILEELPSKNDLDNFYEVYTNAKGRNVEGFVVNYKNNITKYVRMKNGKLTEHFDRGEQQ